ncbi:enoyl-CoA hydratase [Bosea caraganae]|uniref:Enoyl-CoA hydratase n=1 Tax=Bosea caraganae TaxID=2763117 RepID=A0A370LCW4_9HYPH|nr:enoyl-CoA hydratase/isomerase family protein [Bosea caraganae]RDJ27804.1 enoyl-CoA hydratase [Bosea caraganae]RDJ29817.1 enoyl-CoA hydratase [Bosea caraganae]
MDFKHLHLAVADSIATVTMSRPPVNALSREIREELLHAFDDLSDRTDVRAIILAGSDRAFSAGADIKERAGLVAGPGDYRRLNRLVREVFYAVMDCPKPVIAVLSGPALGAGFALALSCDMIIADEATFCAMPEVDVGLAGGAKFLQRHFTPTMARRLLLTGRRISAAELYRLGVVDELRPANELMPAALELAAELAAKSPLAIQLIKDSFNLVENLTLRDGYRFEQDMTTKLGRTEDAQEAKRAFVEKRQPVFVGR